VDRKILPPDAKHKGYWSMVVQNIKLSTENVGGCPTIQKWKKKKKTGGRGY